MESISAVIITKNEQANIGRCLESLKWVDEIIVVDSGSEDDTRELAWEAGATVFEIDWEGFGPAKRYGVDRCAGPWILSVDADEVVSDALAAEIRSILKHGTEYHGFNVPRRTLFLGRWISHCGWYPDHVLRLFLKSHGNFSEAFVHERVLLNGEAGYLQGELRHYCYPTLEHYLTKSNRYTTLGARQAMERGKKAGWYDLVIRPPVSFLSHYVFRQGFRDGMEGFLVSLLSAGAVLTKYAKLRHLQQRPVQVEEKQP